MPKKVPLVMIDGVPHRICSTCKDPKPLDAYHKGAWHGRQHKCIKCCKEYRKQYYADRVRENKRTDLPVVAPAPIDVVINPDPLKATLRTSKFLKYAIADD